MFELRPYQKECIDKVNAAKERGVYRPLVVHPTGAGKTIIMSALIKSLFESASSSRALVLAHRDELIQQARDKLLTVWPEAAPLVGVVKAEQNEVGSKITVASVQSLHQPARLEAYVGHGLPELTVTDECFPAGTLVDERPIETLKPGDVVTAFDPDSGKFVPRRVVRVFCRPYTGPLIRIVAGTCEIIATFNHPFLTQHGWVPAGKLKAGDAVLTFVYGSGRCWNGQEFESSGCLSPMRESEASFKECSGISLPTVPIRRGESKEIGCCTVQQLREGSSFERRGQEALFENRTCLLFESVYESGYQENFIGNDGEDKPKMCFGADEEKEPYVLSRSENQSHSVTARPGRLETPNARRQRSSVALGTENTGRCVGLAYGSVRSHRICTNTGIPTILPDRYCIPGNENRCRSGWQFAQGFEGTGARCTQGSFSRWTRVDHVEVYEQGILRKPGGVCSEGVVYNLEIEHPHTFVANGFVVHNCHHATASTYRRIYETLSLLPGQDTGGRVHLGVTATPDRLDKVGLKTVFDSVVHVLTISFLIESGYLIPVRGILVNVGVDLDGAAVNPETGDFSDSSLARVMESPAVIEAIARAWVEKGENRKTVAFTPSVRMAGELAEALRGMGAAAAFVSGETPEVERRELLRKFSDGEIQVLCNVNVLSEGFDCPDVECILMARPTKSRALYQQILGRGLRPAPWAGKADCLVLDVVGNSLKHRLVTAASLEGREPGGAAEAPEREPGGEPKPRRLMLYAGAEKVVGLVTGFGWLKMKEDLFALYASDRNVAVLVRRKNGSWQALAKDFNVEGLAGVRVLSEGPDQGYVFGAAENFAAAIGDPRLLREDREWRGRPPSEAQIGFLERLAERRGLRGFAPPETRGEASDLITKWRLEELLAGPTERQIFALKRAGLWEPGLTKTEASRRLARVRAG